MLDFQRHPVKIAHINVRTETHGDEEVTAVDLKLTFDVPNFVLDKLSPTLRPSLYEAANDDIFGPDGNTLSLRQESGNSQTQLRVRTFPTICIAA